MYMTIRLFSFPNVMVVIRDIINIIILFNDVVKIDELQLDKKILSLTVSIIVSQIITSLKDLNNYVTIFMFV